MPCVPFQTPNGARGFMCYGKQRQPKCACGKPAPRLCDWKDKSRKSGTCDAPICTACAVSPERGKDLCPTHAAAWTAWRDLKAKPR